MPTYKIEGVHCQACIDKIKLALSPVEPNIQLNLSPPQAILPANSKLTVSELNQYLTKAGNYKLVPINTVEQKVSSIKTYYPLFLIMAYILGVSLLSSLKAEGIDWHNWMNNFMAGFFIVFSAFKLLDLPGFAMAYSGYDLLAKRFSAYGYVYPFLELGLGIAYLLQIFPIATNVFTIILMSFSSLGVLKALTEKRTIQCACLGTALNLPMTNITLIEDLMMVVMAIIMLIT